MQTSLRLSPWAMSSLQREQLQDRGLARGRQVGPQVQRDFRGGFSFFLQKKLFFPRTSASCTVGWSTRPPTTSWPPPWPMERRAGSTLSTNALQVVWIMTMLLWSQKHCRPVRQSGLWSSTQLWRASWCVFWFLYPVFFHDFHFPSWWSDTCGVCEGDNTSCRRESGQYNEANYGYNFVVR